MQRKDNTVAHSLRTGPLKRALLLPDRARSSDLGGGQQIDGTCILDYRNLISGCSVQPARPFPLTVRVRVLSAATYCQNRALR